MKKLLLSNALILLGLSVFSQPGFTTYPVTITGTNIRTSIKIDAAANKWYGTSGKGAYKFDGTTWTVYNTTTSSIPGNYVYDLAFDAANTAWMATRSGLAKFDGTTWTTYNVSNSGLPNDTTNCVFVNGSDVWVGTKAGLAKFDGTTWTVYNTSTSGIINDNITALNISASGDVWVGTSIGLSVKSGAAWTNYSAANSNLNSSQISSIYFESASRAWIGTKTTGIYKFENNVFIPLSSLFMKKNMHYLTGVNTITKGPNGGALFAGEYNFVPGYLEVLNDNTINFYTFPSGYSSAFHAYDNATGIVWFVYTTGGGSGNNLYSFDASAYTGTQQVADRQGFEVLDINQVKAGVMNRGDMHWNTYSATYEVPKNSGRNALFASSLWIGGFDSGNNLHQAAMTYRQTGNDYWPGPLDTITATTDSATFAAYDKIWKLNRSEIEEFQMMYANGSVTAGTYTPAYNILNWPAHGSGNYTRNMAPFVDVNADGMYNPMDGDYPKIKGDQMCYWIFNDKLNVHTETGAAPLGIEVHASAYAYSCDSLMGIDSAKALNYTTFYDYQIYNRSSSSYHNAYVALWNDNELGNYTDDYVGTNRPENYSFTYNADSVDESLSGVFTYGANPPMISNVILNGPDAAGSDGIDNDNDGTTDEPGEKNLLTNTLFYYNNSSAVNGNPVASTDFYNYMQSTWRTGAHVTYGGDGTSTSGTPYNFMYDGLLDGTPWSQISESAVPTDKKSLSGCGPFDLAPAGHVSFNFAIVYTRDNGPAYDIVNLYNRNLSDVRKIKQWYAADNFPSCASAATGIADQQAVQSSLLLYPNPSSDLINVQYRSASASAATLEIYNVQGRLMKQMKLDATANVAINIADYAAGLYILKISSNGQSVSKKFLKE